MNREAVAAFALHHGRIPRMTWLYRTALVTAVCAALGTLAMQFLGDTGALPFAVLFLWSAGVITIQRLHDCDKSAWWLLLLAVPLLGPIWLFVQLCRRGIDGRNRFGSEPMARGDYLQVDISR